MTECILNENSAEAFQCLSQKISEKNVGVDVFFIIFAATLVFLMQTGFAMLCAGSIRSKNVQNVMLKNLLDACGGAIGFSSFGFALAYGGEDPTTISFIGSKHFFLHGATHLYHKWFFNFSFAATTATIVAGAISERCQMAAYLGYSLLVTGFVYPVVVHSVWSESGFLSAFNDDPLWGSGMIDYAGSGVVHVTGGLTAIIAAYISGPRKGRFHDKKTGEILEEPVTFPPHSVSLQVLGTFILWFGWYGFNCGSAKSIVQKPTSVAIAAVSTTLGGSMGCVTSLLTRALLEKKKTGHFTYDLTCAMNGCLAGLVSITGGCAVFEPWSSALVGMIAGWIYLLASHLLVRLRIDDAVDAIPVHLGGGIWGLVATGLFAAPDFVAGAYDKITVPVGGLFFTGDFSLLGIQLVGLLFIIGWTAAIMVPFFLLLDYASLLRVDPLEEEVGLDVSHHRSHAYNIEDPSKAALLKLLDKRRDKDKLFGKQNKFEQIVKKAISDSENRHSVRFHSDVTTLENVYDDMYEDDDAL